MNSIPVFVGLDYHQDAVQVCVMDREGKVLMNRSCRNDWRVLRDAVERVGVVQRAGIEACCGASALAEQLVEQAGWNCSLGHPAYIAKMKGSKDKSDWSDGRLIGDLTRVGYLPRVWLAPAYIRELRLLVTHRQRAADQRRAAKLQVGGILREQRVKIDCRQGRWTKPWIARARDHDRLSIQARWIVNDLLDEIELTERKIRRIEVQLRAATRGDQVFARLMEQEGIGEVTAWVLRAYVGEFGRFARGRQLARYCGMSPANASSGAKQADAGLIDGCNRLLRATVIQAAHRLIRTSDRWGRLAGEMRARGKPANVIVGAVGNRWLRNLHHAMKPSCDETITRAIKR